MPFHARGGAPRGRDPAAPPVPKTVIGGDGPTCSSAWAGTLGIRPSVASFLAAAALGNVVFPRLRPFEDDAARAVRGRLPLRNDCRGITCCEMAKAANHRFSVRI